MPNDLPPWQIVHQQATRWLETKVIEAMIANPRMILRLIVDRPEQPTAAVLDARTLQSSMEGGPRSGYDVHKKRIGAKVHLAVDTLGHLLAAHVSTTNENERAHMEELLANVQAATGESVEVAYVDSGYNGEAMAAVAQEQGVRLEVVSLPKAKKGFGLLPRRWVVERSFAWTARCRCSANVRSDCSANLLCCWFIIRNPFCALFRRGVQSKNHYPLLFSPYHWAFSTKRSRTEFEYPLFTMIGGLM